MNRRTLIGGSSAMIISLSGCLGWFDDDEIEDEGVTEDEDPQPDSTPDTDSTDEDDMTEPEGEEPDNSILHMVEIEQDSNFTIEALQFTRDETLLQSRIRAENISERTFERVAIQLKLYNEAGRHFDTITSEEDTIAPGETHSGATIERALRNDIWDDLDTIVIALRYVADQ